MKHKQEIDSFIVSLFIGVLPILMLSIGHTSTMFYAILVVCLTMCFSRPGGLARTWQDWSRYRWLAAGLFSIMLVIVMVMLVDHRVLWSALERAIRIGAGTFIVLGACLSLRPQWMRQSIWGIGIAAVVAAAQAWWFAWPDFRRPEDVPEYNIVSYGNLNLLVTVIFAFSLGWQLTPFRRLEWLVKALIVVVGFSGFVATQTRTGWLAVPFFLLIGIFFINPKGSGKKLIGLFLIAVIAAVSIFATNDNLRKRTHEGISEFRECVTNPVAYSSVCIRIQLWRASWEMFKDDPLLGIGGPDRFVTELEKLTEKNIVSKRVIEDGFEEPHNEMLHAMASYGLFGLIALLLIYISPGVIFARRMASKYPAEVRAAAAMGLSICVGFWVFGWTDVMFRGMRTMGFYAVTIAWLLALCDPIFLQRESDKKPVR